MKEFITLSAEDLKEELMQAYINGQRNARMMESGLERNEVEDYVNSRMWTLTKLA